MPAWVGKPSFERTRPRHRIVHLGIGAFHRAHQALYTDEAQGGPERAWGITGVSLRSDAIHKALAPQDELYSVLTKGAGNGIRLVGSLERTLVAPHDPAAVIAAIAEPSTSIVTLTVTEKGYFRASDGGGLDVAAPSIAADLRGGAPATIHGYIAEALALRRDRKAAGLTIVSCDNLPGNGKLLRALLGQFLELRDASLSAWADQHLAFPDTMVDRIVPATTTADIDHVEALTGIRDEALVVAEPYRQWVIEDRFAGPRPAWEAAGAQLVDDVAPYELAKLRLLNGSHSTLAYVGLPLGHEFVHEAIADPDLRRLVELQMKLEAAPSLAPQGGLDLAEYGAAIHDRFSNPRLPHRLAQIAMDGSQKIPQRWLAVIAERANSGLDSPHHLFALVAWLAYTRGRTSTGMDHTVDDPLSDRLAAAWGGTSDLEAVVEGIIGARGIVPLAPAEPSPVPHVASLLREWMERGARSTLRRHLAQERADV